MDLGQKEHDGIFMGMVILSLFAALCLVQPSGVPLFLFATVAISFLLIMAIAYSVVMPQGPMFDELFLSMEFVNDSTHSSSYPARDQPPLPADGSR